MAGTLNALGIIACIVITILVLVFNEKRRPDSRVVVFSIAIAILVLLGSTMPISTLSSHFIRGTPFTQWLIPCLGLIIVLCFVKELVLRRVVSLLLTIASIGLSIHFDKLAGHHGITGNPRSIVVMRQSVLRTIDEYLQEEDLYQDISQDTWLTDSTLGNEFIETMLKYCSRYSTSSHFWHTPLTGLYRVTSVPADVWYLGNDPEQYEFPLELRPRPDAPPIAKQEAPEPKP